jgi:hypothetical protein
MANGSVLKAAGADLSRLAENAGRGLAAIAGMARGSAIFHPSQATLQGNSNGRCTRMKQIDPGALGQVLEELPDFREVPSGQAVRWTRTK